MLKTPGLDKATGIVSRTFRKHPNDPEWRDDPAVKKWRNWMRKYYPDGDFGECLNAAGCVFAQTLVQVLKQCGDDLTRENVM